MDTAKLDALIEDLTSGDERRAENCVPQLVPFGQDALNALVDLFNSPNTEHRWWALRAMAAFEGRKAGEYLRQGLNDPDTAVRQCACMAMRSHTAPEAIPTLVNLLDDDDRLLARLAGDALIAQGKAATQPLIQAVRSAPQAARLEAVRALSAIGDPASIDTLFKLLDEESTMMAYWAEKGLGDMGIGMMFFNPGE